MFRNKLLGIAAAATLGLAAMLGSTAAYALKIFDSAPANRAEIMADGNDSLTYAAETLLMGDGNVTEALDESDMSVYHNITDELFLAAPADIGATEGDTYVVAITLDGMVFQGAQLADNALTGGDFDLAAGGASGDKLVVFRLTDGAIDVTNGFLHLAASFAVSAGGGSATLTMTNQTLAGLNIIGITGTKSHPGNVVKIAPGLDETAMATDATADVAASFKKFVDGMSVASVGSVRVGFDATTRNATGTGSGTAGNVLDNLDEVMDTGTTGTTPNSTVTFMGDFSFASKVFTHGDDDCGADDGAESPQGTGTDDALASAEDDLLIRDDDDMVTDLTMTMAANVAHADNPLTAARYLCIMVQGEDDESEDGMDAPRIPETAAYTAMGSYMGLENAAIGPMSQMQTLGKIGRNGATVHIPYMTTQESYNQTLVIVNRGPAADYEITFRPEDGTTATAGGDATGELAANSTTVLSLLKGDVVTLEGKQRTAATIIIEAQPGMISVATNQRNLSDGSTDTVNHN